MTISVVIPALNERNYIGNVLQELESQRVGINEVIVVDGHSDDGTSEFVRTHFPGVQVVNCEVRSPGAQRSLGGMIAKGEVLLFLDADVSLDKNFISKVTTLFERRFLDIAGVRYVVKDGSFGVRFFYFFFNFLFFLSQWSHPSAGGSCIMCRKTLFDDVGGFPNDNPYDDIIFVRNAACRGRFGILPINIYVSDRRFLKYGLWYMWKRYLMLSWYFFVGDFEGAKRVDYEFGKF